MPLFTVIMPVYNVAEWLERSVESVRRLHGDDFEIILVDDGSTDGSSAMCDTFAERDSRIHVIHKSNGGLASARNAGLDAARGEYVLMFDSDDYVEPDTLDALRPVIAEHRPDIIHFDLWKKYPDHEDAWPSRVPEGLLTGEQLHAGLLKRVLRRPEDYLLSACIHAYRLERLNAAGLRFVSEREVLSEDFLFNLQAFMKLNSLYVLARCLYHYDSRDGSLTRTRHKPRLFERYTCLYRQLLASAGESGADAEIVGLIRTYYVHTLFFGTCCFHEYHPWEGHTWRDAATRVKQMLRDPVLREAAGKADLSGLPAREKLNVYFIRMGFEPGIRFAFRRNKGEVWQ